MQLQLSALVALAIGRAQGEKPGGTAQLQRRRGAQVGAFQFQGGEASLVAWSPDDKSLAAGAGTGAVAVFRAG